MAISGRVRVWPASVWFHPLLVGRSARVMSVRSRPISRLDLGCPHVTQSCPHRIALTCPLCSKAIKHLPDVETVAENRASTHFDDEVMRDDTTTYWESDVEEDNDCRRECGVTLARSRNTAASPCQTSAIHACALLVF